MERIANDDESCAGLRKIDTTDEFADILYFQWMADAGVTKEMIAAGVLAYLKRDLRFETESEVVFDIYKEMEGAREEI